MSFINCRVRHSNEALQCAFLQVPSLENGTNAWNCQRLRHFAPNLHSTAFVGLIGDVPDAPIQSQVPQLEVAAPKRFDLSAVLRLNAYGLVLALPVLLSVLVMSALPFGLVPALLPIAAIILGSFFLPFGFGNRLVTRLVQDETRAKPGPNHFIVQATFSPRIRSGLRSVLEDADDLGLLSFTDSELVFKGDSVTLRAPFGCLRSVRRQSLGLRGLYLYGDRVAAELDGLSGIKNVAFAERSSLIIPTSRKLTKQLHAKIQGAMITGKTGNRTGHPEANP